MNSRQRRAMRYRATCTKETSASHKEKEAIGGCSIRVLNAVAVPKRQPKETGSICMPDVAIYYAGYRKQSDVSARG
ncbi:TPA: hypothetical protein ACT5CI_002879 [Edwardsiella tarda]